MKTFISTVALVLCVALRVEAQVNQAEYNAFRIRSNFEVYPNSADDKVTFESPVDYDWQIANQQGIVQMKGTSLAGKNPLEIYALPPGTYYIRFQTQNGAFTRQLLVR